MTFSRLAFLPVQTPLSLEPACSALLKSSMFKSIAGTNPVEEIRAAPVLSSTCSSILSLLLNRSTSSWARWDKSTVPADRLLKTTDMDTELRYVSARLLKAVSTPW